MLLLSVGQLECIKPWAQVHFDRMTLHERVNQCPEFICACWIIVFDTNYRCFTDWSVLCHQLCQVLIAAAKSFIALCSFFLEITAQVENRRFVPCFVVGLIFTQQSGVLVWWGHCRQGCWVLAWGLMGLLDDLSQFLDSAS